VAAKLPWLSVKGRDIVDEAGTPVLLKGYCLGGWLNTENFINGYPFVDHLYYQELCAALGPARAAYYYERQYEHYMTEADIALLRECGTNAVRVPFNYRLFEQDSLPGRYDGPGFEYLDRLVEWCRKHRVYIMLDLHAAQGWQNHDWHCDNPADVCLLWTHQSCRDRVAGLWKAIAARYKDEPTIAGYEICNEPVAPDGETVQAFYEEVAAKIRRADRKHIIFAEGNRWGSDFRGMKPFGRNVAFACHIYTRSDFEPTPYPHAEANPATIAAEYRRFVTFGRRHNVPMWCSEFGAHHTGTREVKRGRLQSIDDQIGIFEGSGHSWSMWTYKDVGVMGLATLDPKSPYMKRTAPVRRLKERLGADQWTDGPDSEGRRLAAALVQSVQDVCGPRVDRDAVEGGMTRAYRDAAGKLLMRPFAEQFRGMTKRQIDAMMKSWRLENCRVNKGIARVLRKHSA
jgi:endoglucanase